MPLLFGVPTPARAQHCGVPHAVRQHEIASRVDRRAQSLSDASRVRRGLTEGGALRPIAGRAE